jgi:hypothetical protein
VRETSDHCDFEIAGRGVHVRGSVSAPRKDFVGWVYADPDGSEYNTVNCSIASMHLDVTGTERARLDLGGAAYELGMRERDHGMPIQPFPDG